jgi:cyclic di-GMP phosphodiesterase
MSSSSDLPAAASPSLSQAMSPVPQEDGPTAVLVLDDDDAVRAVLARFLGARGYRVEVASSGAAALDLLGRTRFAVALCDVRMPRMSGLEFVLRARKIDPDLAIVMLTAAHDAATATEALSSGALDYLMKPIEFPALQQAIGRALERRRLLIEQRHSARGVRGEVAPPTADTGTVAVSVVESLVDVMEEKHLYLRGHSRRTAELGASIAESLGLNPDMIEQVRLAGRVHDVGNIGVPDAILNKPATLTVDEYERVKAHVRVGMEILSPLAHLGPVLRFVAEHHEHWDGSGYPRGLRGDAIAIGARILAAADAFDAITSARAYRKSVAREEAIAYLASHSGTLMDPRVYEAMCRVVARSR